MNITVINGSPKGNNSITLQTVLYLQKHFPEDSFDFINAGMQIKALEKDFAPVVEKLKQADFILFSYPVYTFIAPYQLHRFIELTKENCGAGFFDGKIASQITTSKHFYDTTAQEYVRENCADLGLQTFDGLYADMDDLTKPRGRREALDFWRYIHFQYDLLKKGETEKSDEDKKKFRVTIVANLEQEDSVLAGKIEAFRNTFPYETEIFNVAEFNFAAGCISCFKCAPAGQCIHKDGFQEILREKILTSDAIIYAFTIKDHSMGAAFKNYDDRQFCNGHRTVSVDMPIGYIVNGDLEKEANLQNIIHGRASVGHNVLVEVADSDSKIQSLCSKLAYVLNEPVVQPQNFWGIGGMKIFRDLIYVMGGMMKADYKFYKKEGFFNDFPQKKWKTRLLMKLVGALMSNEKLMKKAPKNVMSDGMLAPYKKALDK